jgi:hypothetical protein
LIPRCDATVGKRANPALRGCVEGVKQRGRSLRQVVDATVDILAFKKIMARMVGLVGKRFEIYSPEKPGGCEARRDFARGAVCAMVSG